MFHCSPDISWLNLQDFRNGLVRHGAALFENAQNPIAKWDRFLSVHNVAASTLIRTPGSSVLRELLSDLAVPHASHDDRIFCF
jgi:hypothetical protein